jgi:hypothetical protein
MRSPLSITRGLLAAGFLLLAGIAGAERIRLGIVVEPADAGTSLPSGCEAMLLFHTAEASIVERAAGWNFMVELEPGEGASNFVSSALPRAPSLKGLIVRLPESTEGDRGRLLFDLKLLTSLIRGLRPDIKIALAGTGTELPARAREFLEDPTFAANVDALILEPSQLSEPLDPKLELWLRVGVPPNSPPEAVTASLVRSLAELRRRDARALFLENVPAAVRETLCRLQNLLGPKVSADRRAFLVSGPVAARIEAPAFVDEATLAPILILGEPAAAQVRVDLSTGGPYKEARVENLLTGATRTFPLTKTSKFLDLDSSKGPLAVRLIPAEKPGEIQTSVTVGGEHRLTAEEIVARERAWKAAQDDRVRSYTADLVTSLRFRIAEVNETFDLTIKGPLLKEREKDFDWAWEEFYVNGIKWKGKTLPKIPILQPEKVTTLPLEIELSEDYTYTLEGRTTVEGHDCYAIDFVPKPSIGEKPAYRGRVWIDSKSFALVKRRSVQEHLKGETLSNVETEFYRPVPGDPHTVLPLEIKGEEVFSTAGRTTAIERSVVFKHVKINPQELEDRRKELYASEKQIVRDTDRGLKYLVPDPEKPGGRIVEEKVSKKSLFGAAGFFYDGSVSYPIPLLGVQYFNFDLFGQGKQVSTFFGGVLLTANYTDPALAGSRFDAGADLFAVAIPFGDVSYRNGREVKSERLKHVPAVLQVNFGHPLGPYLKGSVSLFAKYDGYQRDSDTAPDFVTPQDTETYGATGKLTANVEGFNATADYSTFRRSDWPFWGIPGTSEYRPAQRRYEKWSVSLSKDYYFSGFRKLHAAISYLDGSNLDRFSRYEFGAFSGNPLRGYKSGALRTSQAWLANLSYGLNIEDIIRLEVLYDQAIINDPVSGFRHAYFSGAGISGQLNGPWNNSLIRFDVGFPAVSHGIHGFSVTALILKLF